MSYTNNSSINTKFCSHCKMTGKTHAEYTSHYVRKTRDQTSKITCPDLLTRICVNCPSSNHTWDRCPLTKNSSFKYPYKVLREEPVSTVNTPVNKPSPPVKKPAFNNRFGCLDEEDVPQLNFDPRQLNFDPSQLDNLTPEDQKLCIGEEIYAKVALKNRARAGLITGMLLEFDIQEVVAIFNTPERFDSIVQEANWVLDVAV